MWQLLLIVGLVSCDPRFLDFIKTFEKNYDNEELVYRLGVFKDNLEKMRVLRTENPLATFDVNEFSDLTEKEFNDRMTGWVPAPMDNVEEFIPNGTFADDIDWRSKNAITPIKNQGSCGSCWAFAATEAIESDAFLSGKYSLMKLSPQQIVSCDKKSSGCNGGDPSTAYTYIAANGIETDADYPYTAKTGTCKFVASKVSVKITGQKKVSGGESGMLTALASHPMSVCHNTGGWQSYSGGIMTSCGSGGGHCTQAVGYDSKGDYWIIKNSWGSSWGNSGYLYLKKGQNLCGISNHAGFPTV